MIRVCLTLLVLAFPTASAAATRCYSTFDDPSITITDDTEDIYTLVKKIDGKTIKMRTMSGGTGLHIRVAYEDDGTSHLYRYVGDTLIMDMDTYELGCP